MNSGGTLPDGDWITIPDAAALMRRVYGDDAPTEDTLRRWCRDGNDEVVPFKPLHLPDRTYLDRSAMLDHFEALARTILTACAVERDAARDP